MKSAFTTVLLIALFLITADVYSQAKPPKNNNQPTKMVLRSDAVLQPKESWEEDGKYFYLFEFESRRKEAPRCNKAFLSFNIETGEEKLSEDNAVYLLTDAEELLDNSTVFYDVLERNPEMHSNRFKFDLVWCDNYLVLVRSITPVTPTIKDITYMYYWEDY